MDGEAEYLTLAQVAALTGRHPELLRQWAAAGRVPAKRLGNVWVMRAEDVRFVTAMTSRSRSVLRRAIPSDGRVRLIAASFADAAAALTAAAVLRSRIQTDQLDVAIQSVELPAVVALTLTIVAVRAPLARLLEARGILVGHGGTVIADLDPETLPSPTPAIDGPLDVQIDAAPPPARRSRRLGSAASPA